MIETLGYGSRIGGTGTNADLRNYMRWEYGTSDAGWIFDGIRRPRGRTRRAWAVRARYWLNSFRGFAAFDVRGTDGRA